MSLSSLRGVPLALFVLRACELGRASRLHIHLLLLLRRIIAATSQVRTTAVVGILTIHYHAAAAHVTAASRACRRRVDETGTRASHHSAAESLRIRGRRRLVVQLLAGRVNDAFIARCRDCGRILLLLLLRHQLLRRRTLGSVLLLMGLLALVVLLVLDGGARAAD